MADDIQGAEGVEAQDMPPLKKITEPPHISTTAFQESYYDPTSPAPLGPYVKHQGGPIDPATGRLTGDGFADSDPWRQV